MSKKSLFQPPEVKQEPVPFTGEVYTLMHKPHEGFADYAVATLHIKDGILEMIELSDPYAGFEAAAKLEIKNVHLLEKLRRTYPQGFQHV